MLPVNVKSGSTIARAKWRQIHEESHCMVSQSFDGMLGTGLAIFPASWYMIFKATLFSMYLQMPCYRWRSWGPDRQDLSLWLFRFIFTLILKNVEIQSRSLLSHVKSSFATYSKRLPYWTVCDVYLNMPIISENASGQCWPEKLFKW